MKRYFFAALFITALLNLFAFPAWPGKKVYTIIADLDWTFFYNIDNPEDVPAKELITYHGPDGPEYYRAADFLPQFIESVLSLEQTRIYAFSGGQKERNEFLLKQVRLSGGRTTFDVVSGVFSFHNLKEVDRQQPYFTDRYKKVIQPLIPHVDMTRTILFDDQPAFAAWGLKVLPSLGRFKFHPYFDSDRTSEKNAPQTMNEWLRERYKMMFAFNVIKWAKNLDQTGRGQFADLIENAMKNDKGEWLHIGDQKLSVFFPFSEGLSVDCVLLISALSQTETY